MAQRPNRFRNRSKPVGRITRFLKKGSKTRSRFTWPPSSTLLKKDCCQRQTRSRRSFPGIFFWRLGSRNYEEFGESFTKFLLFFLFLRVILYYILYILREKRGEREREWEREWEREGE
ncbi:unnamed protein product [Brassica rapa subsp. narinosa]